MYKMLDKIFMYVKAYDICERIKSLKNTHKDVEHFLVPTHASLQKGTSSFHQDYIDPFAINNFWILPVTNWEMRK